MLLEGEEASSVEQAAKQLTPRTGGGGGGSGDAASVKSTSDVSLRRECSSDAESTTYRRSGIGILEFSPDRAGMDVTPANLYEGSPDRTTGKHSTRLSTVAGKYSTSSVCGRPMTSLHTSVHHPTGTICNQLIAKAIRRRRRCARFSTTSLKQPTVVTSPPSSVSTSLEHLTPLITKFSFNG